MASWTRSGFAPIDRQGVRGKLLSIGVQNLPHIGIQEEVNLSAAMRLALHKFEFGDLRFGLAFDHGEAIVALAAARL